MELLGESLTHLKKKKESFFFLTPEVTKVFSLV